MPQTEVKAGLAAQASNKALDEHTTDIEPL